MYTYVAHNTLVPIYRAWQIVPNEPCYNLNFSYKFNHINQVNTVINNLQILISLKASLRQTFIYKNNQLWAIIHDNLPAKIKWLKSSQQEYSKIKQTILSKSHNLNNESLIKVDIVHLEDLNEYVVFFNFHHILLDGISVVNVIDDLNKLINNEKVEAESTEQVVNSIQKIRQLVDVNINDDILKEYINQINFISKNTSYPIPKNKNDIFHYQKIMPTELALKLCSLSSDTNLSFFNLILLSYGIFSAKLFDQEYSLVSYPIQLQKTAPRLYGSFINMLTISTQISTKDCFSSLITTFKNKLPIIKNFSNIRMRHKLNLKFIVSCSDVNFACFPALNLTKTQFTPTAYPQMADSNMSLRFQKKNGLWYFSYDILSDLFPEYLSSTLLSRFFNFLNKLLYTPNKKIFNIDLVFEEERKKLIYDLNSTHTTFPQNKTIHQLFEEQVIRTPHNLAVVYKDTKLSYIELNTRANQLAHYLKKSYNVQPNNLIALFLNKNEHALISLLAILKSNGAYVPIDPTHPEKRITHIVKDSQAKLIITNIQYTINLEKVLKENAHKNIFLPILPVDCKSYQNIFLMQPTTNLTRNTLPNDIAYLIYTSGTTGKPKGVLIEHVNVINLATYQINKILKHLNQTQTNALWYSNYVFDAHVWELYSIILNGNTLYILEEQTKMDFNILYEFIKNNNIHIATIPPGLLNTTKILPLKTLIVAGDSPNKSILDIYKKSGINIINAYGPSETTVCCSLNNYDYNGATNIGKPIDNFHIYILDSHKNLLPIGMIGELYIGGIGLARGYLNQNQLTKKSFIKNPIIKSKTNPKSLLYKSGDYVRLSPKGDMHYIGRKDSQINLHGYRIELGEIESLLAKYPDIQQVVALTEEKHENTYIIVYYSSIIKIDECKLRAYLKKHLPFYMLPQVILHINNIPLNINGKLDKQALPTAHIVHKEPYEAPHSQKEILICKAFSQILQIKQIGINDNFFKLGGNSITAILLTTKLQFNFNIKITDIFRLKTPKQIAKIVNFNNDYIQKQLNNIKLLYKQNFHIYNPQKKPPKENITTLNYSNIQITIKNIILTGATGYLGCNILKQLLETTSYKIYITIRANSEQEALNKIKRKFNVYFNQSLEQHLSNRIFIIIADLEKKYLGLSITKYKSLSRKINSIIHCAALTKHFGEYEEFYSANVQATINLLEFCSLTYCKDFHYISTYSIFQIINTTSYSCDFYTEDDIPNSKIETDHFYNQTKLEGENKVIEYRKNKINSNIYRVGNLAFISQNHQMQENFHDNSFYNWLKYLLQIRKISPEIDHVEISPVDVTANAIVLLFKNHSLKNNIFHVFNPKKINIYNMLKNNSQFSIDQITIDKLINYINEDLIKQNNNLLITKFLLHQGWLNNKLICIKPLNVIQNKTLRILCTLGFKWPPINKMQFNRYIKYFL